MPAGDPPQTTWHSQFGARVTPGGVEFRVWAPAATRLAIRVRSPGGNTRDVALAREINGDFAGTIPALAAGTRYAIVTDISATIPDPASRSQPDGVHGESAIVDPASFLWAVDEWPPPDRDALVIYELHVGCFTRQGTFEAAAARLPALADLGTTAVELMPVASFPGRRNWGYDGAALYAPAAVYGGPDGLRSFVDAAHALGIAVILDVVYNHFGPSGAYAAVLSPLFFSARHRSPWGAGINLDGPGSERVREFFIDNALHWIHEYRIDGLRLDATHAFVDESPRPFLAELSEAVHASARGRRVLLIAEDHRNLRTIVESSDRGGWGFDAVWADDFHHAARRLTTGDDEGYFGDYAGTTGELARALNDGWIFQGEHARYFGGPRGTPSAGLDRTAAVICLQNHDQVGNRAYGDRLHHVVDAATYRALSVLLLLAPETPLLFMGQEWAASSPFLYFTDHDDELGRLVREGRRHEFRHFRAFADPAHRNTIPDPQADETFHASQLRWEEFERPDHSRTAALYRDALRLRRSLGRAGRAGTTIACAAGPAMSVIMRRARKSGQPLIVVACLNQGGAVELSGRLGAVRPEQPVGSASPRELARAAPWQVAFSTESSDYVEAPLPPRVERDQGGALIGLNFDRPGVIVLAIEPESPRE